MGTRSTAPRPLLLAAGLVLALGPAGSRAEEAAPALDAELQGAVEGIRSESIVSTIRFLASDGLEGREAGERGLDLAADYLVSRFQGLGLRPAASGWFLQRFRLRYRYLTEKEQLSVARREGEAEVRREFRVSADFAPFAFSEVGTVEAPLVFAGYGIEAPEFGWTDYTALGKGGARGKIVVVFRHEPDREGKQGSAYFAGREMTRHASLRQKARAAAAAGAVGLIVVDGPAVDEVKENPSSGFRWTVMTESERKLERDDPERPAARPDIEDRSAPLGVLAVHSSQELLRWLDPVRDWAALQRQMDEQRKPTRLAFSGITARIVHDVYTEYRDVANVVALLPGSDPVLRDEYVLVGGHYDHEGKDARNDDIYHGADDNASGTAAIVAVAEAFAHLDHAPKRSVLFAAFAAEEKGLLGSERLVRHPPVGLDKIVAGVNLDMVGRNKAGEISIVGRDLMPDFAAIFDRFAPAAGLALNDDAGAGAGRSDNASLWLGGVPTVSLFSGTHEDYHRPTDTSDKIVPSKVQAAARLTFLVVHEIASGGTTPKPLAVPAGPWKPIAPASRLVEGKP